MTYRRQDDPDPSAYTWRRLNIMDSYWLWRRWIGRAKDHRDPLVDNGPKEPVDNPDKMVWPVGSMSDLIRLVGALQHANPRSTLWYRGVRRRTYQNYAFPSRGRDVDDPKWNEIVKTGQAWLSRLAQRSRVFRNRGPLARLAILQHYGVRTCFLDVTRDVRTGLFFAFYRPKDPATVLSPPRTDEADEPHLLVFATPRITSAVTDVPEAGICVVDLLAELSSYCLRPHAQQAGFIGLRDAVTCDLDGQSVADVKSNLDDVCIARIKLQFPPSNLPSIEELFPPASASCGLCLKKKGVRYHDWSYDSLLHSLHCAQRSRLSALKGGPPDLPNLYWKK